MSHRPERRVVVPSLAAKAGVVAVLGTVLAVLVAGVVSGPPALARERTEPRSGPSQHSGSVTASSKTPTAVGYGGAVTSVDANATRVGLAVLRRGGNAADAAVATAAALGVTEPYSSGIGGGGFFVYYNARTGRVRTIDGRETAPSAMPHDAFINPATGKPYTFTPDLVTSGVSVGVPGTLATWKRALHRWGSWRLGRALRPAARLARRGFVVDPTFRQQTLENKTRFQAFPATARLFLPGGDAPAVGSRFRNRALARTYDLIARRGTGVFYRGALARQIARNVRHPRTSPTTTLPVPKGFMRARDLRRYRVINRAPTHVGYRGYDVYGMGPASSGGSTVGEALNILERFNVPAMSDADALHHYLEASALAFADRGKYVGDPAYVHVPLTQLLSDQYAATRACLISPTTAMTKPVAAGDVNATGGCSARSAGRTTPDTENLNTTNLTVADRWGNVAEYTLTIEQTGGSGMVLPRRGFLLNNELTDFSAVYDPADPNRIDPGKRPRSSISPTIVMHGGKPFLALGSPGGSTIITTVLQLLFDRIDRGMSIEQAIAAPRASQRNTASVTAEQAFIDQWGSALSAYGHTFTPAGAPGTTAAEIGAATAIEFGPHHRMTAVAEPVRRGGGSAAVVSSTR
ncbi:gamma-glutamyltransferase [Nocardioides pocheonensis]|uniref:Glutathione hydrolase proenzyme n=1 Tax=Nocardioides pocheonensis TaxID=661485 RepID=A0A3N0GV86_9ACTN|nr:gamma-glutamyltransferase [Nocardioides pocheonensis]RNM16374.1 gamma-glutamyltransferase [Nocardioides pocheonensis]